VQHEDPLETDFGKYKDPGTEADSSPDEAKLDSTSTGQHDAPVPQGHMGVTTRSRARRSPDHNKSHPSPIPEDLESQSTGPSRSQELKVSTQDLEPPDQEGHDNLQDISSPTTSDTGEADSSRDPSSDSEDADSSESGETESSDSDSSDSSDLSDSSSDSEDADSSESGETESSDSDSSDSSDLSDSSGAPESFSNTSASPKGPTHQQSIQTQKHDVNRHTWCECLVKLARKNGSGRIGEPPGFPSQSFETATKVIWIHTTVRQNAKSRATGSVQIQFLNRSPGTVVEEMEKGNLGHTGRRHHFSQDMPQQRQKGKTYTGAWKKSIELGARTGIQKAYESLANTNNSAGEFAFIFSFTLPTPGTLHHVVTRQIEWSYLFWTLFSPNATTPNFQPKILTIDHMPDHPPQEGPLTTTAVETTHTQATTPSDTTGDPETSLGEEVHQRWMKAQAWLEAHWGENLTHMPIIAINMNTANFAHLDMAAECLTQAFDLATPDPTKEPNDPRIKLGFTMLHVFAFICLPPLTPHKRPQSQVSEEIHINEDPKPAPSERHCQLHPGNIAGKETTSKALSHKFSRVERLHNFKNGDHLVEMMKESASLLGLNLARHRTTEDTRNVPDDPEHLEGIHRIVFKHLQREEPGKAMQLLKGKVKMGSFDDNNLEEAFIKKFPEAQNHEAHESTLPDSVETNTQNGAPALNLSWQVIQQAARRWDRSSKPGPDGLPGRLLQSILTNSKPSPALAKCRKAFTRFANKLVNGAIPAQILDRFWMGRAIPLIETRPDGTTKPRPAVCPGTLRRFIMKAVSNSVRSEAANKFQGYQFGIGVPDGAGMVALVLRERLRNLGDDFKGQVLCSLDGSNAFNQYHRQVTYNAVRTFLPQLTNVFLSSSKRSHAVLYTKQNEAADHLQLWQIRTERGVDQGCPMSPLFYCLTEMFVELKTRELLGEQPQWPVSPEAAPFWQDPANLPIPNLDTANIPLPPNTDNPPPPVISTCYIDDKQVLGQPEDVARYLEVLQRVNSAAGGILNPRKYEAITKRDKETWASHEGFQKLTDIIGRENLHHATEHCLTVANIPVTGQSGEEKQLAKKHLENLMHNTLEPTLGNLRRYPRTQDRLLLLRLCHTHAATYALRGADPELSNEFAQKFKSDLINEVSNLGPNAWRQLVKNDKDIPHPQSDQELASWAIQEAFTLRFFIPLRQGGFGLLQPTIIAEVGPVAQIIGAWEHGLSHHIPDLNPEAWLDTNINTASPDEAWPISLQILHERATNWDAQYLSKGNPFMEIWRQHSGPNGDEPVTLRDLLNKNITQASMYRAIMSNTRAMIIEDLRFWSEATTISAETRELAATQLRSFTESSLQGATKLLEALPRNPNSQFSNAEFSAALAMQTEMDFDAAIGIHEINCRNKWRSAEGGRHFLKCNRHGGVAAIRAHDAVQRCIANLINKETHMKYQSEPLLGNGKRRADGLLTHWKQTNQQAIVEISTHVSGAQSNVPTPADIQKAADDEARIDPRVDPYWTVANTEKRKRAKYKEFMAKNRDKDFIFFAMSDLGGLGKEASNFLKEILRSWSSHPTLYGPARMNRFYIELACAHRKAFISEVLRASSTQLGHRSSSISANGLDQATFVDLQRMENRNG